MFVLTETLSQVDLISNDWKLIFISESQDLFHMIFRKDSSHRIGWIDDKDKLSVLIDQGLCMF